MFNSINRRIYQIIDSQWEIYNKSIGILTNVINIYVPNGKAVTNLDLYKLTESKSKLVKEFFMNEQNYLLHDHTKEPYNIGQRLSDITLDISLLMREPNYEECEKWLKLLNDRKNIIK